MPNQAQDISTRTEASAIADADLMPIAVGGVWDKITGAVLKGIFALAANKDATGGYAGLTLFKINFKNVANTFTSFFTNSNTAARTYTFQDKTHTVASAAITATDQTASRALNTTYTNPYADRSILVVVSCRCVITLAGGRADARAKSDTSTPPTTVVSGAVGIQSGLLNEDNAGHLVFVVPAGATQNYRVDTVETNGTVAIGKWFEYVL